MSWQTIAIVKAVLCLAATAVVLLRYLAYRAQRNDDEKYLRGGFLALAAAGAAAAVNFGHLHGGKYPGTVHVYDMYHYYLGAKYFPELRYDGLYAASVVAAQEDPRAFPKIHGVKHVRDLKTKR